MHRATLRILIVASLAGPIGACGGGSSGNATSSVPAADSGSTGTVDAAPKLAGFVAGTAIRNPTGFANSGPGDRFDTERSTTGDGVVSTYRAIAYDGAQVCIDVNDNGRCDTGEDSTTTSVDGSFVIATKQAGAMLAVIGGPRPMILKAPAAQTAVQPIVISPLSTEVARSMASDSLSYDAARKRIADRLTFKNTPALPTDIMVTADEVLADLSTLADPKAQHALLMEQNALASRYALATAMFDRGTIGGEDEPVHTLPVAQDAAFAVEDIPRYDHLFVIIFENHPNQYVDTPKTPTFFQALNLDGNKASNYFSGGNPSEPNYVILGSADDWGIADDSGWNCTPHLSDHTPDPVYAPSDVYQPRGDCDSNAHNIKGRRNLFNAMFGAGLPVRVYSESMDPGQDPRNDGQGNPAITAPNRRYQASDPMPSGLYRTKHHPAMNFDEVRNRPNFFRDLTRSVGGGQWDAQIADYATAHDIKWNTHQLEDDLQSGDVGALNYIVPDQCDDAHGLQPVTPPTAAPLDCDAVENGVQRADDYLKYLLGKIEASPVWTNTAKRTGIVLIFDEGSIFPGSASCCGWNSGGGATSGHPLDEDSPPYPHYASGNKGDGPTIFGVINNQPGAPRGKVDADSYSHYSFVRTLQDMFALADPGAPTSYMNRSKYTEDYISKHLADLTEYAGSANPHFDAVRAMNHHYAVQTGDTASDGEVIIIPDGVIPGQGQPNIWALK